MATVPWAVPRFLPENGSQPVLWPTQLLLHSIVGSAEGAYRRFRDSSNLESHFIVPKQGSLWQLMDTSVQADANHRANVRALSVETEDNGSPDSDPWTDAQLETLIELARWANQAHGIPLVLAPAWDQPGLGFHSQYPEWSTTTKTCPGAVRIRQFFDVILPALQEEEMNQEDRKWIDERIEWWMYRTLAYLKTGQPNQAWNPGRTPELPFGGEANDSR